MKRILFLYVLVIQAAELFGPLVLRLTVGWIFFTSGWGKLNHLAPTIEFFQSLGIPLASIQAPLVAGVEFVGGLLLLIGLYTRAASLPLVGVMAVAIATAFPEALTSLSTLLGTAEFLYLVILLALMGWGGGKWSVDYMWRRNP